MKLKYEFNHSAKCSITDYPYVVLSEQAGTFEMAAALGEAAQVFLHRDYEVEELAEGFQSNTAGMTLKPTELDLKRFTQVYTTLSAGKITGAHITDDYIDHAGFVAFVKKFGKLYPKVPIIVSQLRTDTGYHQMADYVTGFVVDGALAKELAPKAHRARIKIIYPRAEPAALAHDAIGANLLDISSAVEGTPESAGVVIPRDTVLIKKFRDNSYYSSMTAAAALARVHDDLEKMVWQTGYHTLKDFTKYAREE